MLTLRTLGTLDLRDSNGNEIEAVLSQPKRYALLAFLAVARPRGFHRRDTILGLFWPERDEAHARNALSQSLSFLRRNLSDDVLIGRGVDEVALDPELVQTDVAAFEAAVREGRWTHALNLYRGDFLRGLHLDNARGFGDWMEAERERLRELAAGGAWALAREQIKDDRLVDAERTAQRALGLVWSDETPVREFIKALAEAGDGAAALRFYEKFRTKLWEELELEPSLATSAVADAIRNGKLPATPSAGRPRAPDEGGLGGGKPVAPQTHHTPPGPLGPWRLWFWSLASAAIVCFAAVGILRFWWAVQAAGPPPDDRPFTVLAQVGGSAEAEEREAVAFLLRSSLDMAHVVHTVPLTEVDRVLRLMEVAPGTALDPELAREVAIRLGVPTIVLPRLDHIGEEHILAVRVEDVHEGLLRAESRGQCDSEAKVVEMVDGVTRGLRRRLGERRAILANTERLPEVITPSLDALIKYRAAEARGSQAEVVEARKSLWEAVALDPAFAMAWQRLSDAYLSNPRNFDSAAFAAGKVQQYRNRLTEARWADVQLHARIHDDIAHWDRAFEDAERAVRADPTWITNYALRLGHEAGLPDSAWAIYSRLEAERAETARRLEPEGTFLSPCQSNYLKWSVSLDRTGEWMALLDSLGGALPEDCLRDLAFFEAQAEGDWDRADSLLQANAGSWRWPFGIEWTSRQLLAIRGRIAAAYEVLTPPEEDPFGLDQTQRTRLSHLFLDLVFGPHGNPLSEGTESMVLAGRGKFPVVDFLLHGIREGLVGDTLESQRVASRLQAMRDTATSRTFELSFEPWFVLLDLAPPYRREDWRTVVSRLEPTVSHIRDPGVGGYLPGAAFLSWWILADAYEGLGRPEDAIVQLEAFFSRPTERLDDWAFHGFFRPGARLRLGHLYAQLGDRPRAEEHLIAFLDTFNDPDPEYGWMVAEARATLETLRTSGY